MKRQLEQIIDKRSNVVLSDIDSIIEYLQDILPHGSGIDSTWSIEYRKRQHDIICHNSFHYMDENGYYDGWYDFSVCYTLTDYRTKKVCSYCNGQGKRSVKELAKYHNDDMLKTVQLLNEQKIDVFYDGIYPVLCFYCNVCNKTGYLNDNPFEFKRFMFHNVNHIPFGLKDYLEELLYNPEDAINWTIQQQQKSA